MERSESVAKLAAAMVSVQGAIGVAVKDKVNPHFRSNYADLGSVWTACRSALQAAGVAVIQSAESVDGERIGVRTMLVHESGEWMSSVLVLKPVKADPQGAGSAITYARRYGLAAMVGVVADDDDDGNAASTPTQQPQRAVAPKTATTAATGTGSLAAVREEIAKWSGMKGNDLAEAMKKAGRAAGCGEEDDAGTKVAKVRTWIDANKGNDFLEVTK